MVNMFSFWVANIVRLIPKLSTISTWLTLNDQVELLIAVFREAGVGLEEKEVKKIKIFDSYFRFFSSSLYF